MLSEGLNCKRWLALGIGMVRVAAGVLLTGQTAGTTPQISPDASTLDIMVQSRSYSELERQLPQAHLTGPEREYFQAVLDNRTNHPSRAVTELERVLPELQNARHRSAIALQALTYDYFELGRYGDAADELSQLLKNFARELSPAAKQNTTNDRNTFDLLRGAPPQSISGEPSFKCRSGATQLMISRSPSV